MVKEFKYHPHPRPYYPWVVWILSAVFIFYSYLVEFAALVIHIPLHTKRVGDVVNVTTLLDPYAISALVLQIPVALLIDKFGPRKMTSLAIVIFGLGSVLFGYSTSAIEIWLAVFILGVGGTVTIVNILKLASNWFVPKRFAMMVGWTMTVAALGAFIGQRLAFILIHSLGWRLMMINFGIVGIVYGLLFFCIVRDNAPGAYYSVHPQHFLIPLREALRKVFTKPQNYLIALFLGLSMAPWIAYSGVWHIPFFKTTYNVSDTAATFVNSMNIIAFAIGAPFFGWLSTKSKSRKKFMFLGVLVTLIVNICTVYIPYIPFPLVAILTSLSGFFISATLLAYPSAVEQNNPTATATVVGMTVVSLALFKIVVDRVIGFLFISSVTSKTVQSASDISTADFQTSLVIVPITLILSLLILFFIKETRAEHTYE